MVESSREQASRGDLRLRATAVSVATLVVAGLLAAAVLEPRAAPRLGAEPDWIGQLLVVGAAGLVVAWARPRNVIGWLLLVAVLLQTVSLVGGTYAQAAAVDGDAGVAVLVGAWLAAWTWFPSLALPVAVLPTLYPEGRPTSRGRRLLAWAGCLGVAGMCLALAAGPDAAGDVVAGLTLPFPEPPAWLAVVVFVPTLAALAVSVVGGLAAASWRALRSPAPERQQMLWLLVPLFPYVVGYFFSLPLWLPGYALVGVAVAIGILRYRLLDIRIVVRRALFYVPLVALVFLLVAAVSTGIARVTPDGPLPLVGAAVAVAVLVGPVTGWLRRAVDRFTLGLRADPVLAVTRVADVGQGESGADPLSTLVAAVVDAVGVGYAAVLDESGDRLAWVGPAPEAPLCVPLCVHGTRVGALVVEPPHDAAGRRVVNAVVPHVATVLYGRRLAAELDAERGRAAEAAGTERERIRADLHDGLGPSLSGISLGLQAVDTAMTGQQRTARAILARTRAEADSAVREVRRVVDALGPDALAGHHLPRAIRDVADRLGFDGREGPAFEVRAHELGALPAEVEQVAYRIAGEALHNVARHARASRCVVTVGTVCDAIELCVSDDGVGIDPASGQGVGLDSMRGRARAFGGTCTVASRPNAGTVVSVRIPLATP